MAFPIWRPVVKNPIMVFLLFLPLLGDQPLLAVTNHFPVGGRLIGVGLYSNALYNARLR